MTQKTEDEWINHFGEPQDNPLQPGSSMFNKFGAELDLIQAADEAHVWSVIEGDETENLYLLPGFHAVNNVGYVLSHKAISPEELASGEWDEVLWVDENEMKDSLQP
jgi:hypothetical protein